MHCVLAWNERGREMEWRNCCSVFHCIHALALRVWPYRWRLYSFTQFVKCSIRLFAICASLWANCCHKQCTMLDLPIVSSKFISVMFERRWLNSLLYFWNTVEWEILADTTSCESLKSLPEQNLRDFYFCDSLTGQQLQVASINSCRHKVLQIAFIRKNV